MNKMHVKTGDTVIVISGDDKGVKGEVLAVSPDEKKVIVKGANIVTKHTKPRRQGETGGIIKVEGAMYASRFRSIASHAKRLQELHTRSRTARKSAFAQNAARNFNRG